MLVLSRQLDESIVIGDDIIITIVDVRGDKVRVGIAAPSDIPVHRQEIHEIMTRETMEAAFAGAVSGAMPSSAPAKPFRLKRNPPPPSEKD